MAVGDRSESSFEKFSDARLTVLMANAGVGGPTKAPTSEGMDRILSFVTDMT